MRAQTERSIRLLLHLAAFGLFLFVASPATADLGDRCAAATTRCGSGGGTGEPTTFEQLDTNQDIGTAPGQVAEGSAFVPVSLTTNFVGSVTCPSLIVTGDNVGCFADVTAYGGDDLGDDGYCRIRGTYNTVTPHTDANWEMGDCWATADCSATGDLDCGDDLTALITSVESIRDKLSTGGGKGPTIHFPSERFEVDPADPIEHSGDLPWELHGTVFEWDEAGAPSLTAASCTVTLDSRTVDCTGETFLTTLRNGARIRYSSGTASWVDPTATTYGIVENIESNTQFTLAIAAPANYSGAIDFGTGSYVIRDDSGQGGTVWELRGQGAFQCIGACQPAYAHGGGGGGTRTVPFNAIEDHGHTGSYYGPGIRLGTGMYHPNDGACITKTAGRTQATGVAFQGFVFEGQCLPTSGNGAAAMQARVGTSTTAANTFAGCAYTALDSPMVEVRPQVQGSGATGLCTFGVSGRTLLDFRTGEDYGRAFWGQSNSLDIWTSIEADMDCPSGICENAVARKAYIDLVIPAVAGNSQKVTIHGGATFLGSGGARDFLRVDNASSQIVSISINGQLVTNADDIFDVTVSTADTVEIAGHLSCAGVDATACNEDADGFYDAFLMFDRDESLSRFWVQDAQASTFNLTDASANLAVRTITMICSGGLCSMERPIETDALAAASDSTQVNTRYTPDGRLSIRTQAGPEGEMAFRTGDNYSGAHNFDNATFEIPNLDNPSFSARGQIALDTLITGHTALLKYEGASGDGEMAVIAIKTADLGTNDEFVPAYDSATSKFRLVAIPTAVLELVAGVVSPNNDTDDLAVGGDDLATSAFYVDQSAGKVYIRNDVDTSLPAILEVLANTGGPQTMVVKEDEDNCVLGADDGNGSCGFRGFKGPDNVSGAGGTVQLLDADRMIPVSGIEAAVGRAEIDETLLSIQTHATDCTLLTCDAASDGEQCFEQDANVVYTCDGPAASWEAPAATETNNLEASDPPNVADTEIYIGTGAGTGAWAAMSGDATMSNAGVVTLNPALNLLTTGTIRGMMDVVTTTITTDSPTADEMRGTMHISNNASGTDYTLPTAVAGMSACFYDFNGGGVVTLDAATGDEITLDGLGVGLADAIDSAGAKGDFICLLAIDATNWLTLGRSGTWIDGGVD